MADERNSSTQPGAGNAKVPVSVEEATPLLESLPLPPRKWSRELNLLPVDGKTPEELSQRPKYFLKATHEPEVEKPYQFSLAELMLITTGVALGAAGGRWFPSDVYAALMGLVTVVGLLVVTLHPPQSRWAKIVWGMLIAAYAVAVFVAILKPT